MISPRVATIVQVPIIMLSETSRNLLGFHLLFGIQSAVRVPCAPGLHGGVDGLPKEYGIKDGLDRISGQDKRILREHQRCKNLRTVRVMFALAINFHPSKSAI